MQAAWEYWNPVRIVFQHDGLARLVELIGGRRYGLVTYGEQPFRAYAERLGAAAGAPLIVVDDVAPNPDFGHLRAQCTRFAEIDGWLEVLVALGGGSVIDSAKVFAAARGDFARVERYLVAGAGRNELGALPIIAVPTTAGTGSEVTSWATVWDTGAGQKYSLSRPELYPEAALIDPDLMLGKPYGLTRATGLDALSHALESLWNLNANPVSTRHAVFAARTILSVLPALMGDLGNIELRAAMAEASLAAGLAFSNTKTAIAHNLSYPITLGWGVQHGIACSFTLPAILRSVAGSGGFREAALHEIFGPDLTAGAERLASFLSGLGVGLRFADHGVPEEQVLPIVDAAFAGERGRNFIGTREAFLAAARAQGGL